ncbi:MAG TPA: hypothetical protein VKA94_00140 [Hyphomicrobiales bacterium]|nr:hypothetical protein [Hyphomicrobiales bacterium]
MSEENTKNVFESLDLPYHAKAVEIVEQIEFLDTENKRKAVSAIASALEAERLEEREACAKLIDEHEQASRENGFSDAADIAQMHAAAIRSRETS